MPEARRHFGRVILPAAAMVIVLAGSPGLGSSQMPPWRYATLPAPWHASFAGADSLPRTPSWLSPLASAVLPGAGQLLRGDDRGAVYLIAEAFLLQRFISLHEEALRDKDRYRDIALKVARAPFNAVLRDTVFEYFEQMGRYLESGPYSTDPGPKLVPPTDETTYNGNIWALARRTYIGNSNTPSDSAVAYQAALAFYRSRAIGPSYTWSWRDATVEQDLFRQTIQRGDETFRRSTQELGLVLANHFLSAVDAFVSERLSRGRIPASLGHRLVFDREAKTAAVEFEVAIHF